MRKLRNSALVSQALWELLCYDARLRVGGFALVRRSLRQPARRPQADGATGEAEVCRAIEWAVSLYWKPVQCLQRSVVTVRILRKRSLDAKVVVGCRPEPFFSHAWVEVGGRVVYGSPRFRAMLQPLMQL